MRCHLKNDYMFELIRVLMILLILIIVALVSTILIYFISDLLKPVSLRDSFILGIALSLMLGPGLSEEL